MDLLALIKYIVVTILSILVSGNNLSINVGSLIGTRILSFRQAVVIALCGHILGLYIHGFFMRIQNIDDQWIVVGSIITILLFIIGIVLEIPLSLVTSLYIGLIGISLALSNVPINTMPLLYWLILPFISIIFAYLLFKVMSVLGNYLPRYIEYYKLFSIITAFILSFTFGANNLGLLWGLLEFSELGFIVVVIGCVLGVLLLGWRVLYRFVTGLYTLGPLTNITIQILASITLELGTLFSIPVPVSIIVSFGLIGTGIAHRFRIINPLYSGRLVVGFIVSILMSLVLCYIIAWIILNVIF